MRDEFSSDLIQTELTGKANSPAEQLNMWAGWSVYSPQLSLLFVFCVFSLRLEAGSWLCVSFA